MRGCPFARHGCASSSPRLVRCRQWMRQQLGGAVARRLQLQQRRGAQRQGFTDVQSEACGGRNQLLRPGLAVGATLLCTRAFRVVERYRFRVCLRECLVP